MHELQAWIGISLIVAVVVYWASALSRKYSQG